MDILNFRSLREDANRALARGRDPKKLIYSFAGISVAMSLLVTLVNLFLDGQISGTGGLSNLGTRAIFTTIQQVLPMVCNVIAMCLGFGYISGMMRISRGQYADHTDLKVGFRKFWPLVRLILLQAAIAILATILAIQVAGLIFALTPWAGPAMEIYNQAYAQDLAAMDSQTFSQLLELAVPMYIITGIVMVVILVPVFFRMRLATYCLLDDPNGRAMAAIAASNRMMRRRFWSMLKVDLSLWVYYAATVVMVLVMYSDLILYFLDIAVPIDSLMFSLLVYLVALALEFLIQITLRNKVEAVYLTAYDRLREKPKDDGAVVLGNIFDM